MISVPLSEVEPALQSLRKILAAITIVASSAPNSRPTDATELSRFSKSMPASGSTSSSRVVAASTCARWPIATRWACRSGSRPRTAAGVRLVSPYKDLAAAKYAWSQRQLSKRAWLRSWFGAQQPHFNWTDPAPALRDWWDMLFGALRRVLRRSPGVSWSSPGGRVCQPVT